MWHVQSIQIVWFTAGGEVPAADEIYQSALLVEADSVQKNRHLSGSNRFLSVADGTLGDTKYIVQVQPGRIDMFITVAGNGIDFDSPIQMLPLAAATETARLVIERVTGSIPGVHRVAHVGSYVVPVKDYDEAANRHFALTGVVLPLEGISDLLFQVNRRIAAHDGFEINRLLRLGVIAEHGIFVADGQLAQGVEANAPKFALSLALDFNSVPSATAISADDQKKLFSKLLDETARFLSAGNPIEVLKGNV